MTLTAGTLIEHSTWGRGKVVAVTPPHFTAHFLSLEGSPQGPERRLQLATSFVKLSPVQSDPRLDHVGTTEARRRSRTTTKARSAPKSALHSLEQAIEWFVRQYPGRFADPKLERTELGYKRRAQALFQTHFGAGRGEALLKANDLATVATALKELYSSTNIPSRFELMAAHDGLESPAAAGSLLRALLHFVDHQDADTFGELTSAVAGLPAPAGGTPVLTWPNVTILPFLADPSQCMVLKPVITRRMARRMGVDLMYSMPPTWHTYSLLVDISSRLLDHLAPLGATDFIDVQTFIWVTQDFDKPAAAIGATPEHGAYGEAAEGAPEVIVSVGAEGGSVTLEGRRLANGEWQFRVDKRESWLALEDPPEDFMLDKQSRWTRSFSEALADLGRYPWPRLWPLSVHPEFVDAVLEAVDAHPRGGPDERTRWTQRLQELATRGAETD